MVFVVFGLILLNFNKICKIKDRKIGYMSMRQICFCWVEMGLDL